MKNNPMQPSGWLIMGLVAAVLFYVASLLFPNAVVLGNDSLNIFAATVVSATLLTIFVGIAVPFLMKRFMPKADEKKTGMMYGLATVVGLWILSRFALVVGFGISSFAVAIFLGAVISGIQFGIWKFMSGKKKGK